MKITSRARHILITALLIAAVNIGFELLFRPSLAPAQVPGRQKVVYKVAHVKYNETEIQAVVDIFSRDGWELVSHYNEILIFKKTL